MRRKTSVARVAWQDSMSQGGARVVSYCLEESGQIVSSLRHFLLGKKYEFPKKYSTRAGEIGIIRFVHCSNVVFAAHNEHREPGR
jgi:hypothetical protein